MCEKFGICIFLGLFDAKTNKKRQWIRIYFSKIFSHYFYFKFNAEDLDNYYSRSFCLFIRSYDVTMLI